MIPQHGTNAVSGNKKTTSRAGGRTIRRRVAAVQALSTAVANRELLSFAGDAWMKTCSITGVTQADSAVTSARTKTSETALNERSFATSFVFGEHFQGGGAHEIH